jgi:hypothetical protein
MWSDGRPRPSTTAACIKTRFPLRVNSTIRCFKILLTNRFYCAEPTGEDARRSINAKHKP